MYITPISMNRNYSYDCQKPKSAPSFGMALIFKKEAIRHTKNTLMNYPSEMADLFVKKVTPLAKRATKSNVDVIVDVENNKLVAKVMDDSENLGFNCGKTYVQESDNNVEFIKNAVEDAEKLSKINKGLKGIPTANKN